MLLDDIRLAALGSYLPPEMSASEAAGLGLCDPVYAASQQMRAVTVVAEDGDAPVSGPQLAVAAARQALRRAGPSIDGIDLLLHSALYYQGHDMWAPASYVQRHTVGDPCLAIDVRQTSNGGMASLYLAARQLATLPTGRAALLTTGDRFCLPGIDRWRSDPGTVFADGGTAAVLTRGVGFARLRGLALVSGSELETMHRGDDPWHPGPLTARAPLDVRHTTRDFLRRVGSSFVAQRMAAGQRAAAKQALAEADATIADISWFVLPNFGARRMEPGFFRPFGIDPARTTWPWGRSVGHLGAGDQFAGLAHLARTGRLRSGELIALMGVGGGFTWSCAVFEIISAPDRS
ncbi:3-oxoacyl-ACP synthase III [Amorphoplanes nipponensis]|uniref:3-oxoacyl-ACP synthase III n=1 Tax=Actinoplanes nipponensis TaxID=135950 RepID=A0A919JAZ9_9ACTN|nr:ketoacyl-ACP synthase III family protein [Actinoplanes nipponensis]GIE47353.1 3-oxoacyl-ACP synthase III [Actinoplanes nipponensis]